MPRARHGKIARLPRAIREELNRRLADGHTAEDILTWVNALSKTQEVLTRNFEGVPISPQNLSEWRSGGYADWVRQNEREESIRSLADYSYRLAAAAGGSISDGAAAIAGGHILSVLETIADGEAEELTDTEGVIRSLAKLRGIELDKEKLRLDQAKHETKRREVDLAERRFQTMAVETFLKWAKSEEARKILDLGQPQHVQVARLRELMFGPSPTDDSAPA